MYRTIDAAFWTDPKVRKLSKDARYVLLYLITNPHSHVAGIYYLLPTVATEELSLSPKQLDSALDTLSGAGLARFDANLNIVWVVNMFKYQGKGVKNLISASRQLQTLHNSFLCYKFSEKYPQVLTIKNGWRGIGYPAQGSQEQEQEQEQENNKYIARIGFSKPTVEEVAAYCSERKNQVNPQAFIDYYTANGWRVGKNPMKNWQAAVRTWETNHASRSNQSGTVGRISRVSLSDDQSAAIEAKTIRSGSAAPGQA